MRRRERERVSLVVVAVDYNANAPVRRGWRAGEADLEVCKSSVMVDGLWRYASNGMSAWISSAESLNLDPEGQQTCTGRKDGFGSSLEHDSKELVVVEGP